MENNTQQQQDLHPWHWINFDLIEDEDERNRQQQKKNQVEEQLHHFRFQWLPPSKAKELMTGYPNIDPDSTQNNSPTQQQLINAAQLHNGYLEGYVIKVESEREDSRITCDGIALLLTEEEAQELQQEWEADEFNKQTLTQNIHNGHLPKTLVKEEGKTYYRYWWD